MHFVSMRLTALLLQSDCEGAHVEQATYSTLPNATMVTRTLDIANSTSPLQRDVSLTSTDDEFVNISRERNRLEKELKRTVYVVDLLQREHQGTVRAGMDVLHESLGASKHEK